MNKKECLTNFKVMFSMLVGLVLLILLFLSSNIVHALTASMWGTELSNKIDNLTSVSNYTYVDYNSDTIKEFIFNRSNEQFFDNTLTQSEFYQRFNYVVMGYSQSTIRVFVQNYERVMDYQGLNAIVGNETRFFFANLTAFGGIGVYSQLQSGVNAIYSYYIDINYNTLSFTFSDNNPLTDLNFYLLGKDYKGGDYGNYGSQTIDINMQLFDSYNGNFSWIESWNELENTNALWLQASGEPSYSNGTFYNSIIEFPELQYVSSGTPDDETPDDNENGQYSGVLDTIEDWLSKIEGNTNSSKGFLEGIGETLGKIGESIGEGLNDLISALNDTLEDFMNFFIEDISKVINAIEDIFDFLEDVFQNILQLILQVLRDIYSFISGDYDLSGLESFFDNFTEKDYGLSIFITGPLDILSDLDSNACKPIKIPLPLLNENNSFYLPCMSDFYHEQIPVFLNWWQILSNALVIFFVGRGSYNAIHDLLDPKARDSAMRGLL